MSPPTTLLVVTGLNPQVVTETLYALAMREPCQLPREVHVMTTSEGAERARLTLLSERPGWFRRLLADWRSPTSRSCTCATACRARWARIHRRCACGRQPAATNSPTPPNALRCAS